MHRVVVAVCIALISLVACTTLDRAPVPEAQVNEVTVLGRDDLRYWGDKVGVAPAQLLEKYGRLESHFPGIMHREHHYLVLSGGAENGAYGAGVLTGWTETGERPEFTLVTGISTGALIAPFAFLGSDYDAQLRTLYTTMGSDDLFERKGWLSILGSDSMADTSPFQNQIARFLTDAVLDAIAAEYLRGRQLYIGTTNLDAARPVVWNITRIAASGHPDAYPLIRSLFLASAALPGMFPPVYVPVEGNHNQPLDEMHVDGGVTAQLFFIPGDVDWQAMQTLLDVQGTPTLYVIRNAKMDAKYQPVAPNLMAIGGRTIGSLIRTQGMGDIYRLLYLSERDHIRLKATWIPADAVTDVKIDEVFDTDYMRALFEYGRQKALAGEIWLGDSDRLNKQTERAQ
ncbi:patatin-like phospholipase family protein [Marinobacter hydrocarbonoclasticus]|nr:patatin-like phospholipase family protein [Marinobacter nauticus]